MKMIRPAVLFGLLCAASAAFAVPADLFQIRVVDEQTGRGVPLVELTTTNHIRFVTDSAGNIALRDGELLGEEIFFHVFSHGYEFPTDGFGQRGVRLKTTPGGEAIIKIKRRNIAERLYRLTGSGIYSDTVALGLKTPLRQPLANGRVAGSDSVQTVKYQGKLFWLWGDTVGLQYPLGNFHMSGATSRLPLDGGLDPADGVDFEYFVDKNGFAKPMAPLPGEGPTWLFGVVVLPGGTSGERLFAGYEKVRGLVAYERGLAEFDPARSEFAVAKKVDKDAALYFHGHPFERRVDGKNYIYFGDPYPVLRVAATAEDLLDEGRYEGFTCLKSGDRTANGEVERDARGNVVWGWKRATAPVTLKLQTDLNRRGMLKNDEFWVRAVAADSGKPVTMHRGSVAWNPYRERWVLIATEIGGKSQLGEVWYAEAEAPEGPWRTAVKIVTHEKYSFYNPKQHPQFASDGGRTIFFEGTYTHTFSGNDRPTAKYEYNQLMYRLDVDDPRLRAAR